MSKLRNVAERAFWTAIEAGLAVFVLTDASSHKTAAITALAAALSVVKNAITEHLAGR